MKRFRDEWGWEAAGMAAVFGGAVLATLVFASGYWGGLW